MATKTIIFNFADMRFLGELQNNTPVTDGAGGQTDVFTTILTTRVSLEKLAGTNSFPEGKMEYQQKYQIMCRYQSAIVLNSNSRWLIRGEYYTITDPGLVDELKHLYVFHAIKNQP